MPVHDLLTFTFCTLFLKSFEFKSTETDSLIYQGANISQLTTKEKSIMFGWQCGGCKENSDVIPAFEEIRILVVCLREEAAFSFLNFLCT